MLYINHTKEISGQSKVDIVAHSMGGIVTRTYIQSDYYGNDIRGFAMAGTPNQGAPFAYLVWEDGNTKAADEFSFDYESSSEGEPNEYFYSNSVSRFMETKWNEKACSFSGKFWNSDIVNSRALICDNRKIKRFVREHSTGIKELLPTYHNALIDSEGNNIVYSENDYLISLNENPGLKYSGINVGLFAGSNVATLDQLKIGSDGKVIYGKISANILGSKGGDGTVPFRSVNDVDFGESVIKKEKSGKTHGALPLSFYSEIATFISNLGDI